MEALPFPSEPILDRDADVAEAGAYVRVWTRDAGGRWRVAVDVTRPGED